MWKRNYAFHAAFTLGGAALQGHAELGVMALRLLQGKYDSAGHAARTLWP